MKTFKTLLAVAALTSALTGIASAADIRSSKDSAAPAPAYEEARSPSWSGVYIGGHCGYGYTELSEEEGQGGISASGGVCGARLGIDLARNGFLVGVYGEYNFADKAIEVWGTKLIEITDDWSIMGRGGVIVGKALLYGTVGYTEVTGNSPAGNSGDVTASGLKAGLGLEYMFAPNLTLGIEVTRAWLDADDIVNGLDDVANIVDDRALFRANYKFNSYTFGF